MMKPNMNPMNPMNPMHPMNRLNRSTFMLKLGKKKIRLKKGSETVEPAVCEVREQQQNLVSSAILHFTWAFGANLALGKIMSAFDNVVLSSCDKLTRQHNLAAMVENTCNSILHYEALRIRTCNARCQSVKLIKHWKESCILTVNLNITITIIEESLVQLLQLKNNV